MSPVPHIDCKAALMRLWDYLDEELTEQRMAEVREHLATCERCLPHARFAERLLEVIARQRPATRLSAELRERVLETLQKSGYTPT